METRNELQHRKEEGKIQSPSVRGEGLLMSEGCEGSSQLLLLFPI